MNTFPFGKYSGLTAKEIAESDIGYLKWAASTDIPKKHPKLGAEINEVLGNAAETTVTLKPFDLPELHVRIRGGGSMHQGNSIFEVTERFFERPVSIKTDNRSGSGKSGGYTLKTPTVDGVYLLKTVSGSIGNPDVEHQYLALKNGEWFEIAENNKNAVEKYMRSQ